MVQIHKRLEQEFVEEVLKAFNEGRLSEEQACELLGIKRTRLYELRERHLRTTLKGEEFRLYGRIKGNSSGFPEEVEEFLHQELKYIRDEADIYRQKFNFAYLTEKVDKQFGVEVHRNSIRRFAIRHDYYHMLPEEKGKVYTRFETAGPGALYQHDTSQHLWLPAVGGYQYLILTKDDMSRKVVGTRLVMTESAWAHLQVARETIETYGLPLAYYVDNHSMFRFVGYQSRHYTYKKKKDEGETQFKRALKTVTVDLIYTQKGEAEAKGKVEKQFDYFQRRLPFECERYGVKEEKEGNKILDDLVGYYNEDRIHEETKEIPNKRWERAEKEGKSKLRPLPEGTDMEMIFSLHDHRTVRKDGTILVDGKFWKVGKMHRGKVKVCFIPGKKFLVVKDGHRLWEYQL